eukprot:1958869-Amphidinium_carterae.2
MERVGSEYYHPMRGPSGRAKMPLACSCAALSSKTAKQCCGKGRQERWLYLRVNDMTISGGMQLAGQGTVRRLSVHGVVSSLLCADVWLACKNEVSHKLRGAACCARKMW